MLISAQNRTIPDLLRRLKAYEGQAAATEAAGKDPVNAAMIRNWCEAMGHAVPEDGAAPAAMLQVWTMGGLSGHGGGNGGARTAAYEELLALLDEAGCTSVVATDSEQEYVRPLRPGERISFDTVIESVSARKSTKLGRQLRGSSVNQVPGAAHVLVTAGTGVPTSGLVPGAD